MEKKRSIGVTTFGSIFILLGIYELIFSLPTTIFTAFGMMGCRSIPSIAHAIVCIQPAINCLLFIIIGIGIIRLCSWARRLIIIVFPLIILSKVPLIIVAYEDISVMLLFILQVIFYSYIIYFFTRPKVKRQFMKNTES